MSYIQWHTLFKISFFLWQRSYNVILYCIWKLYRHFFLTLLSIELRKKTFLLYDMGKLCSKSGEDRPITNVTILSTDAWRTDGRTDVYVILYSLQCYVLHWTDSKDFHLPKVSWKYKWCDLRLTRCCCCCCCCCCCWCRFAQWCYCVVVAAWWHVACCLRDGQTSSSLIGLFRAIRRANTQRRTSGIYPRALSQKS